MAQVDNYLEFTGIKGESTDDKFKDMVEVLNFGFGVSNAQSVSSGTGGGSVSRANFHDFTFTTHVSKASPNLWLYCASGEHISSVKLHCRKATGKGGQTEYLTITMTDAFVTQASHSGAGGGEPPHESYSLQYSKIEFEYKPQKNDGTLDAPIKSGWNIVKNTKV